MSISSSGAAKQARSERSARASSRGALVCSISRLLGPLQEGNAVQTGRAGDTDGESGNRHGQWIDPGFLVYRKASQREVPLQDRGGSRIRGGRGGSAAGLRAREIGRMRGGMPSQLLWNIGARFALGIEGRGCLSRGGVGGGRGLPVSCAAGAMKTCTDVRDKVPATAMTRRV